jgi:UDP-N-acetylmuramoyl-tripeptide--D-alanyl-D-alanine ligase
MYLKEIAKKGKGNLIGPSAKINKVNIDTRSLEPGDLFVAIKGDRHDGHDFLDDAIAKGASSLVVEKKLNNNLPQIVVKNTLQFLKDLAKANCNEFNGDLICITGSNGKTTTKEMISIMLSSQGLTHKTIGNKNNLIGMPLSVADLDQRYKYSVVELGTSAKGEIKELNSIAKPSVAIITNVSAAHLNGLESLDEIVSEKGSILNFANNSGIAILPYDSPYFNLWSEKTNAKEIISFGVKKGSDFTLSDVKINLLENSTSFNVSNKNFIHKCKINGVGFHNALNATAAIATCSSLDMKLSEVIQELERIQFPVRRLSVHKGFKGSMLIDDTYNSNPESMKRAIDLLNHAGSLTKIIAVGEMGELGYQSEDLHKEVCIYAKNKVDHFFCIGELWASGIRDFNENGLIFKNQNELINHLKSIIDSNSCILLKGSRSTRMDLVADKFII